MKLGLCFDDDIKFW